MARHLILIGNSEYNDRYYSNLSFVKNDIEKLDKFLYEYGDFRTKTCFFNDSYLDTKKFLENYIKLLDKKDDLFFYYSGHAEVNKYTQKLNFIFKDTEHDNMDSTSIGSDFLKDFLVYNKSKSKYFILDCCYSGAFIEGLYLKKGGEASTKVIENVQDKFFEDAKGIFGIASSRKSQPSHGNKEKSLFTECIMNGLESGNADYSNCGYITGDDLCKYINSNFNKNIQVPREFKNGEGSIYISRVPKAVKIEKQNNKEPISSTNNKEIELKNKKIKELESQLNTKISSYENIIKSLNNEVTKLKNNKTIIIQKPKIKFTVDSYVQFGKYYNKPILWKCMKNDEFGYLLVSEYIICLKPFDAAESGKAKIGKNDVEKYGSNKWEKSNIREWLNSNDVNVKYTSQAPTKRAVWDGYNAYANEPGFLTNFESDDVSKINKYKHDDVSDIDKVFLLSNNELENVWSNNNGRIKYLTKLAVDNSEYKDLNIVENAKYWYWTRTPSPDYSDRVYYVDEDGSFGNHWGNACSGFCGVVPALYLKSDISESGKGSKKEPYII